MKYSEDFVEKLRQINKYLALFYVPAWLKSSVGTDVAVQNLLFLQNMLAYKSLGPEIAEARFNMLLKHKWYISEKTVVFTLFSDYPEMTATRNEEFVKRLRGTPDPEEFRRDKPVTRAVHLNYTTELHKTIGPE